MIQNYPYFMIFSNFASYAVTRKRHSRIEKKETKVFLAQFFVLVDK